MSKYVLSVGTTHPRNVAGVGIDAQIVRARGWWPLTVVAAVSAQDERGVRAVHAVPSDVVAAQFGGLATFAAVRIGALGSAANVRAVSAALREAPVPIVIDPVISASRGGALQPPEALETLSGEFFSDARVVLTPNAAEVYALCGEPVNDLSGARHAARALVARGMHAAIVTGGHWGDDRIIDVVATADATVEITRSRLPHAMPGTGCTFAAELACELACGRGIAVAAEAAVDAVRARIEVWEGI